MKTIKINTFGVDVDYQVPESVEEFDRLAGKQGACLLSATMNEIYRGSLPTIRDVTLHGDDELGIEGLDEITGVERLKVKSSEKTNEDGTVEVNYKWDEAEAKFFKRVCATKQVEPVAFAAQIQAAASATPFDPSRPERVAAGPRTVAKTYIKLAERIAEEGRMESSAAKLSALLGRAVEANVDSISRAIAEAERREKQNLNKKY